MNYIRFAKLLKQDPSIAQQKSQGRAGRNFSQPRALNLCPYYSRTHLTSVLGWKAAGLSCGENFGTMSDGAEAEDGDGEEGGEEGGVAESAAGTANRLRTTSRN